MFNYSIKTYTGQRTTKYDDICVVNSIDSAIPSSNSLELLELYGLGDRARDPEAAEGMAGKIVIVGFSNFNEYL